MEKNKLLKVSSILLIIFGALILLAAIVFFAAGDLVAEIIGQAGDEIGAGADAATVAAAAKMVVVILGVVLLIEGIAYIAAGVVGIQQKSAKACFIIAIVLVSVCGIGAITSIVEGQIISAITGLVVPVLYLVGAIQLKKAVADEALAAQEADYTVSDEN